VANKQVRSKKKEVNAEDGGCTQSRSGNAEEPFEKVVHAGGNIQCFDYKRDVESCLCQVAGGKGKKGRGEDQRSGGQRACETKETPIQATRESIGGGEKSRKAPQRESGQVTRETGKAKRASPRGAGGDGETKRE